MRRSDRNPGRQLHQRRVPLLAVGNACAVARRRLHSPEAQPLGTIRSLAYFVPVMQEVLDAKVGQDYFNYLRYHLARYFPNMGKTPASRY